MSSQNTVTVGSVTFDSTLPTNNIKHKSSCCGEIVKDSDGVYYFHPYGQNLYESDLADFLNLIRYLNAGHIEAPVCDCRTDHHASK